MQNQHPEDRAADRVTEAFLRQCRKEGRITDRELAEISLDRGGIGCSKPTTVLRIESFIARIHEETGLPEPDIHRILALHLKSVHLTVRHLELYLNYPAWTEQELADLFGITQDGVSDALAAVRRAWPGLRFDVSHEGDYGVPALENMKRIEHYDCSGRLDSEKVEWF